MNGDLATFPASVVSAVQNACQPATAPILAHKTLYQRPIEAAGCQID